MTFKRPFAGPFLFWHFQGLIAKYFTNRKIKFHAAAVRDGFWIIRAESRNHSHLTFPIRNFAQRKKYRITPPIG